MFPGPHAAAAGIEMATKPARGRPRLTSQDTSAAVDAYMLGLQHPLKAEVEALRGIVLGAADGIAEGIKWNAPSFRTSEYFATTHLRAKGSVGLILHLGARARELPAAGLGVKDPGGLLRWLAKDRALVEFSSMDALTARQPALQAVIRQWVKYV
jgi:hypothetical protein